MHAKIYELQGYVIALDHIAFLTRVFEAKEGEGYQFNIRFTSEVRLSPKYPTRNEADLARSLLVEALKSQ